MRGHGLVAAVALVAVLLSTARAVEGSGSDECSGHGTATADNSTCVCDDLYYGVDCGHHFVKETPTLFCLEGVVDGEKEFCFTMYPLDCMDAASVNLILYSPEEGVPLLANKYLFHGGQTSAEICSRTLAEGEASCVQERACLELEDADLSEGVLSASVSFVRYCGDELQMDLTLELGVLQGETAPCGSPGTLYPAASLDLGDITAEGIEVDDNGCVWSDGLALFCPIVLMDPCGAANGVLISSGEVGVFRPLVAGLPESDCHPRACVDLDNVEFLSDNSVSFQLNITDPNNANVVVTYSHITAVPRECGVTDADGDNPGHDYWPLVWEILAAGVMVLLCLGLIVVAMVVVMYRRKHGDPSGYGVMDSDPDSLLEELGDEEGETA